MYVRVVLADQGQLKEKILKYKIVSPANGKNYQMQCAD